MVSTPPPSSKLALGSVIGDKYRLTREIGRGGMAAVYEAENTTIGKRVAVKVLAAEYVSSTVVVERFLREARAAAAISSPYICDVYDSGKLDDGRPFLVLELLEGESLYERMSRVRQLDLTTTVQLVTQVSRGLTRAHAANIVHRDLKPENIFLTKDEEGRLLTKILDFGLAKFYAPVDAGGKQARLTREGAVFGTPAYMSPEQVKGQGQVDHRADLWALGCMTYECLTGRTVWQTEQGVAMTFAQIASAPLPSALALRSDLPPEFEGWFGKALARNPDERFQTAKELAEGLAALLDATGAPPSSTPSEKLGVVPLPHEPSSGPVTSGSGPRSDRDGVEALPSGEARPISGTTTRSEPATEGQDAQAAEDDAGGRLGLTLFGAAVIIAAGYLGWLFLLHPTPPLVRTPLSPPSASPSPSSSPPVASGEPSASAAPVGGTVASKAPKWASLVEAAQAAIANNDFPGALKSLKEAADVPGAAAAKAMMEQAQMAAAAKGACRVTGLGHPKPLGSPATATGRPSLAFTPHGAVVSWTDDHESTGHDHAYSALFDGSLRDTSIPRDITPEATSIAATDLFAVGDRLVALYTDAKGPDAGLHARWLDSDGRIAGAPVTVTTRKLGSSHASIDRATDGTFWVAWEDAGRGPETSDLFLRHLGPELSPSGGEIRATEYLARPARTKVRSPTIAVSGGYLNILFGFERGDQHAVRRLRIASSDPVLEKGFDTQSGGAPAKDDRELGEGTIVSFDKSKAELPQIDCTAEGCFVGWREPTGAYAGYMEAARGQVLWRKKFDAKGTHPGLAIAPSGASLVAWFEGGRLDVASVGRDGVGAATPIARAMGELAPPSVSSGAVPGEWYVAWLTLEAGHPEPYAARVLCK